MKRLNALLLFLFLTLPVIAQQRPRPRMPKKAPAPYAAIANPRKVVGPLTWTSTFMPLGAFEAWPYSGAVYGVTIGGILDLNTTLYQQGPITITSIAITGKHVTEADYCPISGCTVVACGTPASWQLWAGETQYGMLQVTQQDGSGYTGSFGASARTNINVPAGTYLLALYYNGIGSAAEPDNPNAFCKNYPSQFTVQYTIP